MMAENLSPYACNPVASRGRLIAEPECQTRTVFQRDRDRIIHSAAFRRLEYKTQVFVNHEGDHYRTRLTHSLEVAQLARSMARALKLNDDLAEALALAHDLGHPPFGHAGEDGLSEVMRPYGGFDHNAQAIRILTRLEQRYAAFDGLNLTWETLEGIAKHNGPLKEVPWALEACNQQYDLELTTFAGAEAQIAAHSDDIAYNNHDIEDGIRAGFFTIDELRDVPVIAEIITEVDDLYHPLEERRRVHEIIRRVINHMATDLVTQTQQNLAKAQPTTAEDIRRLNRPLVHFSQEMQASHRILKAFLMERMYRHYKLNRMASKARRIVSELFSFFLREPECLPPNWQHNHHEQSEQERARSVADFVAGMTDRFAMQEYQRIFKMDVLD